MRSKEVLFMLSGIVALLLTFSYGGNLVWSATIGNGGFIPEETTIGGTTIGGLEEEEAVALLKAEVASWQQSSVITVRSGGRTMKIPASTIDFRTEETIGKVTAPGDYTWEVVTGSDFEKNVRDNLPDDLEPHFEMKQFVDRVKLEVSTLPEEPLEYNAYAFVSEDTKELFTEVASYSIPVTPTKEMEAIVHQLGEWRVPGKSTVSLLEQLESLIADPDHITLNQAATVIYGSLLETPFVTEERHLSLRLPAYAELGKEAAVDIGRDEDLSFTNTSRTSYYLTLELEGNRLMAVWSGYPFIENPRTLVSPGEEVEPRKTIRYSTSMTPGSEKVLKKGKPGRVVEVYRDVSGEEERELLSEDYYPPVDTVVERFPVSRLSGTDEQAEEVPGSEAPPEDDFNGGNSEPAVESGEEGQSSSSGDNRITEPGSMDEVERAPGAPPLWEPGNDKK